MSSTGQTSEEGAFVISRTFKAPREVLWKAWTEPKRMQQWWGPRGCAVSVLNLDFRPGGRHHYSMCTPDGNTMWGRMDYREIDAPERIEFINAFSDEKGGLTRHPMSPTWPIQIVSTITFREVDGGTEVTVRWVPLDPTEVERQTFDAGRASVTGGWTGSFDQLEAYLAEGVKDPSAA